MAVNGVYDVDRFADAIADMMREYGNVTKQQVDAIAKTVANRGVTKLKTAGSFEDGRGDYRTGWRAKKVKGKWVVHNETDYRLTHLLEKGHAKVGGGRTQAFPHIKPTELEMIDEFRREIREVLSR